MLPNKLDQFTLLHIEHTWGHPGTLPLTPRHLCPTEHGSRNLPCTVHLPRPPDQPPRRCRRHPAPCTALGGLQRVTESRMGHSRLPTSRAAAAAKPGDAQTRT